MKIVIIEGYDNFSNERYIKDAKYSVEEAELIIQKIKSNGSLPDSYQINECTLEDLESQKVKSVFTGEILNEIDLKLVKENLSQIENSAPAFSSEQGQVPEIDPSKFVDVASVVSTFEQNDLITRNVVDFKYDANTDYIFFNVWSLVNGEQITDVLLGFKKDKIIDLCRNVLTYFENEERNASK